MTWQVKALAVRAILLDDVRHLIAKTRLGIIKHQLTYLWWDKGTPSIQESSRVEEDAGRVLLDGPVSVKADVSTRIAALIKNRLSH